MSEAISTPTALQYKRVLLKLSGEALQGQKEFGIDGIVLKDYALAIKKPMNWAQNSLL